VPFNGVDFCCGFASCSVLEVIETGQLKKKIAALARPKRVIQVGANEGKFEYAKVDGLDFLFEFLLKRSRYEAMLIEPSPDSFEALKLNYSSHRNKLHFFRCAVSDKHQTLYLNLRGRDGKMSFLSEKNDDSKFLQIAVECFSVQSLMNLVGWDRVGFVKVDAEGYDSLIVASILNSLPPKRLPKILMWEVLDESSCDEVSNLNRLVDLGYKVFRTGLSKDGNYMDRVAFYC